MLEYLDKRASQHTALIETLEAKIASGVPNKTALLQIRNELITATVQLGEVLIIRAHLLTSNRALI